MGGKAAFVAVDPTLANVPFPPVISRPFCWSVYFGFRLPSPSFFSFLLGMFV